LIWRPLINQQWIIATQNTKKEHESQKKGFKNIFLNKLKIRPISSVSKHAEIKAQKNVFEL